MYSHEIFRSAMSISALLAFMQHYVNISNMLSLIQYRGFQVACPRSISNFHRMRTGERVCGVRLRRLYGVAVLP